ncbi:MAG TPA: sensor domain-containing protein, partial [Pseudonocardiaceae bacterium]
MSLARWVRQAILVAAIAAFGFVSACGSVDGYPEPKIAPGTVESTFLPIDDVSALVGTTLMSVDSVSSPPAPLSADPAGCAVAVGPATQVVYTRGWQRFGSVSYQDPTLEHVVTQVLGGYPNQEQATSAFGSLVDGLAGCAKAVHTNQDHSSVTWNYTVGAKSADSVAWTATQNAGDEWTCFHQGRRKGTALLEVSVCQAGDGGQAAKTIMDRFAA